MKDAVRLAVYLAAVVIIGALLAPILFWIAQTVATHSGARFLSKFDFETFFHRALLIAAALLVWPFFRSIKVRRLDDLGLTANPHWRRDACVGFICAIVPLLCCGAVLVALGAYSVRPTIAWGPLAVSVVTAVLVPLIEESFFRGMVLGILLRSGRPQIAIFITSAFFAILHFLKAPEQTSPAVTWTSGFTSIAHSFAQFGEPMLVVAGFTTLFLIGWILADARIKTRSLWLPIGLHAGWILGNSFFNKIARRELLLLPWLGRSLLIGIIPLGVAGLTWIMVRRWLSNEARDQV